MEFAAVIFKISFLYITSHFFSTYNLFKICGFYFHVIFHIQLLKLPFKLRSWGFQIYAQLMVSSERFVYRKEMQGLMFSLQTFAVNKIGN